MAAAVRLILGLLGVAGVALGMTLHPAGTGLLEVAAGGTSAQRTTAYYSQRQREHDKTMNEILSNMTLEAATSVLRSHMGAKAPAVLTQMAGSGRLRVEPRAVDKAKNLLNTMLEEVAKSYDMELDRCCDFAEVQTILLEETKQDIAFFGAVAAEAREHILSAEQEIETAETNIPIQQTELAQHKAKCKKDIKELQEELKLILADINVMSIVLGLTDCKAAPVKPKTMMLLSCNCSGEEVLAFGDESLDSATSSLASRAAQQLLQQGFQEMSDADMVTDLDSDQNSENIGTVSAADMQGPNGTLVVPEADESDGLDVRTITSRSPCKAPGVVDKRSSKCSVKNNPNCRKLQERFLLIQSGILDKRDELMEMLAQTEKSCSETEASYDAELKALALHLKDSQTKLASATEGLNTANEQARVKHGQFKEFTGQWQKETKTCQDNYLNLEEQECGLKKIRAELFKMQSSTTTSVFQDCVLSSWEPGECTASCAGGTMVMARSIVSPPKDGMKYLPLSKSKSCNTFKCPIHCKMEDWEGWSSCSADCGGGMRERARQVDVRPRYNGEPCEASTETATCNSAACDADCVLHDWTDWSECSKMCSGGSKKRIRVIKEPATGDGTCAPAESEFREEFTECNTKRCLPKLRTARCESKLDVVLLLDGSGSIGRNGWAQTKKVGKSLAMAFHAHEEDIQVATILYSGPRRWRDIQNCGGDAPPFGWTNMYAKGAFGKFNPGPAKFNELFKASHMGILRRQCMWCRRPYKDIYFRWKSNPAMFDAWQGLMVTWSDKGFKSDFSLFSTLNDALRDTNQWRICNGNDPGIGFPRDCAPNSRYRAGWQWTSLTRGGQRNIKWTALTKMEVDMEKDCNIKIINHFTNDTKAIQAAMDAMEWPKGATLTAQALQAAEELLPLSGRADAPSVVIVLTDGHPMSKRKTYIAARRLRKKTRLVWVPVSRYAPRKDIKKWASERWQENVVDVKHFRDLDKPAVINKLIEDVCPKLS